MKKCPQCERVYTDNSLNYCLEDGATLFDRDLKIDDESTAMLPVCCEAKLDAT